MENDAKKWFELQLPVVMEHAMKMAVESYDDDDSGEDILKFSGVEVDGGAMHDAIATLVAEIAGKLYGVLYKSEACYRGARHGVYIAAAEHVELEE